MNVKFASIIAIAGALALPLAAHADDTTMKEKAINAKNETKQFVKDSVITTKIKSAFVKDKTVSALHIKVDTDAAGYVLLSGTATSQMEIDRAVKIARGIEGVTDVDNQIQIKG
jgi:hyperosmotically inducible protein